MTTSDVLTETLVNEVTLTQEPGTRTATVFEDGDITTTTTEAKSEAGLELLVPISGSSLVVLVVLQKRK